MRKEMLMFHVFVPKKKWETGKREKKGMGERCITNGGRQCALFFWGSLIKPQNNENINPNLNFQQKA
jgi:hypothetical protein